MGSYGGITLGLGGSPSLIRGTQIAKGGLLSSFSGAAAAYSLRDLGGNVDKVARVRREPHDTDATINDERVFRADEVQSGTLENWVNGKLETTLPADLATAQGSYSLRKIKESYSGNVVRIRRTSDDVEVNVAFDPYNKVGTDSSISTVSGSTNATDLNGFLNESTENFTAIAYDDIAAIFKQFSSTPTISNTAIAGSTGTVDVNGARLGFKLPSQLSISDYSGLKIKVTGTINSFTADSNLVIGAAKVGNGGSSFTPPEGAKSIASGTTGDFEFIFTGDTTNTFQSVVFIFGDNSTFDISNLKFEIIEHAATVHTWYNQSGDGSNGATQATSTKQPKIANNGTLLDHLLFDGTDDFLADTNVTFEGAVTLACLSEKSANGLYPISAARQGATNRFFGLQEQASASAFLPRNSLTGATITTPRVANKRLTFARTNSDTDQAIASMGKALETGTNDYGNTPTADLINHFVIGALSTGTDGTPNLGTWNGKIFETIGYQTDETDNKFKLESNVNNYYNLYNDANDLEANEFTGTSGTYTNNSKDGFTFVGTATQSFVGIELKESVPVGETIYVSFNCSHNAYSETTLIGLRASSVTGSNASTSYTTPQYGFGVASLTSTNANAKFITFQIRQDSPTVTVSDFKVSRIARDGVIQTLYDQSGNGNNATQSSATKQPYIVQNGGLCKMTNGNAAVMGARYASDKIHFLEMATGISEPYTMFTSMYSTRSFGLLFGGDNVGSTPRMVVNTNGLNPYLNATDNMGTTSTDNTVDSVVTLFSAENGGTAVLRKNGTQIDSLTRADDEIRPIGFLFRHQSNVANKGIFFDSFILYGSDKTSDFTDIEDQLKLANNIS